MGVFLFRPPGACTCASSCQSPCAKDWYRRNLASTARSSGCVEVCGRWNGTSLSTAHPTRVLGPLAGCCAQPLGHAMPCHKGSRSHLFIWGWMPVLWGCYCHEMHRNFFELVTLEAIEHKVFEFSTLQFSNWTVFGTKDALSHTTADCVVMQPCIFGPISGGRAQGRGFDSSSTKEERKIHNQKGHQICSVRAERGLAVACHVLLLP